MQRLQMCPSCGCASIVITTKDTIMNSKDYLCENCKSQCSKHISKMKINKRVKNVVPEQQTFTNILKEE